MSLKVSTSRGTLSSIFSTAATTALGLCPTTQGREMTRHSRCDVFLYSPPASAHVSLVMNRATPFRTSPCESGSCGSGGSIIGMGLFAVRLGRSADLPPRLAPAQFHRLLGRLPAIPHDRRTVCAWMREGRREMPGVILYGPDHATRF